jgi:hypothetical protein
VSVLLTYDDGSSIEIDLAHFFSTHRTTEDEERAIRAGDRVRIASLLAPNFYVEIVRTS